MNLQSCQPAINLNRVGSCLCNCGSLASQRVPQAHLLRDGGLLHPFHAVVLRLKTADETVIAPALNELSVKMADTLSIGSYPVSAQRDGAGIVISLEGAAHNATALLCIDLPMHGC